MPDSLNRFSPDTTYLRISARNTYDIGAVDTVYFVVTRPDGTSNGVHISLIDTGLLGDSIPNDGRYSRGIIISSTNAPGPYTFSFYAINSLAFVSEPVIKQLIVY